MITVRDECKRRRGDEPCIKTYAADMVTVTETSDCVEWCPVLRRAADLLIARGDRKEAA